MVCWPAPTAAAMCADTKLVKLSVWTRPNPLLGIMGTLTDLDDHDDSLTIGLKLERQTELN